MIRNDPSNQVYLTRVQHVATLGHNYYHSINERMKDVEARWRLQEDIPSTIVTSKQVPPDKALILDAMIRAELEIIALQLSTGKFVIGG
jgi:hypothetical protein